MALEVERKFLEAAMRWLEAPSDATRRDMLTAEIALSAAPASETSWPVGVAAIGVLMRGLFATSPPQQQAFRGCLRALVTALSYTLAHASTVPPALDPPIGRARLPYKEG